MIVDKFAHLVMCTYASWHSRVDVNSLRVATILSIACMKAIIATSRDAFAWILLFARPNRIDLLGHDVDCQSS
jgi:hypothetical protein